MMHENEIALVEQMDALEADEFKSEKEKDGIKPMTEDELVQVCMEEVARGIGGNISSDNDHDISLPLDYYHGRLPALSRKKSKDPNASRYVSQDFMDAVESTMAEIMPTFDSETLAFYRPTGKHDEDQARKETEIVNYLFMEEYNGNFILQSAIRDALLHRNGSVKVFWDERDEVTYETFEDVSEMAMGQILEPTEDEQSVEIMEQEEAGEGDEQAQALLQQAQIDPNIAAMAARNPEMAQQVVEAAAPKYNVKIRRTTRVGKPVIKNIPPENTIVAGDHDSPFLNDARFVAHESIETASTLIAMGIDPEIVNTLEEYNSDVDNVSRSRNEEENDYSSAHRSTRLIRVFDCYPLVDFDGDGIAERRRVLISTNKLLSNEEYDSVAIVSGVVQIVSHKYKGVSMFDRLKDIQDAKTPIMRSIIDATQLSSNPRLGVVDGAANIDDILTSRTGGIVRMERADGVFPFPNPEVPQSSYQFLQHMDTIRRDRGGGSVDSASQSAGMSGDTGFNGLNRVMNALELKVALMATTIAETLVRDIFVELHNILRKHYKGNIEIPVGGNWMDSTPSQWAKRASVKVQVGSSVAERNQQAQSMQLVVGLQKELAANGSIMYSEDKMYRAISDTLKISGVKSPDRYFVDPQSEEGKQASEAKGKQSQEMQQVEEAAQAKMLEAQDKLAEAEQLKGMAAMQSTAVRAENEGLKNQITALKDKMDIMAKAGELQFKYDELRDQTAVKLTELEINSEKEADEIFEGNKEEIEE